MNGIENLMGIIRSEEGKYRELLACLEEKQPHLIKSEIAEIDGLVKREAGIIVDLNKLEKERVKMLREWGQEEGWRREDMNVSGLILKLQGEERNELKSLFDSLTETLDKITAINRENERIVRDSLEYLDFTLNLLRPTQAGDEIYGPTGQTQQTQARRLLDQQA